MDMVGNGKITPTYLCIENCSDFAQTLQRGVPNFEQPSCLARVFADRRLLWFTFMVDSHLTCGGRKSYLGRDDTL